ncbi:chromodomain-helicase-DNA-binding protein, partial [Acrasis kona]
MFERASKKLGLDRAVLNSEFDPSHKNDKNDQQHGLDKEEIDVLLRFGAYAANKDDHEEEALLVEGDIDSILERNSTIVRYDSQSDAQSDGSSTSTVKSSS